MVILKKEKNFKNRVLRMAPGLKSSNIYQLLGVFLSLFLVYRYQ